MEAIRAICFDLDNTLWDVWPTILRAERVVYDFIRQRYPRIAANVTPDDMRAARERVSLSHPHMSHDYSFHRIQALRQHAVEHGYEADIAEEVFEVFLAARCQVELYQEVLPALEQLRGKYRLFSASNGNADLHRIGLAHLFERSVNARQAGAMKPDGLMFRKVIEATDLTPAEVLFVGDDPLHDVEGARRAGMLPVWINRTGAEWPADLAPPPHAVTTLGELLALLGPGAAKP